MIWHLRYLLPEETTAALQKSQGGPGRAVCPQKEMDVWMLRELEGSREGRDVCGGSWAPLYVCPHQVSFWSRIICKLSRLGVRQLPHLCLSWCWWRLKGCSCGSEDAVGTGSCQEPALSSTYLGMNPTGESRMSPWVILLRLL